jgi:ribonuclease P protein component
LLTRRDFQGVYDRGRRHNSPLFTAFALPRDGQAARVGFTTPRALGPAVVRNRLRRRLRDAVRRHFPEAPAGWDVVLNPRAALVSAPAPLVESEVQKLFAALRAMKR